MRKLIHLGSGLLALAPLIMPRWGAVCLLVGITAIWLLGDLLRIRGSLGLLNRAVSHPLVSWTIKPRERRGLSGGSWLLLSYTLVVLLFPPPVASLAILVSAICDPAAYLAGRLAGAPPGTKSLWGSLAFLVSGVLVSIIYVGLPILPKAVGVALGAVGERASGPLDDNLLVPLAVALGTWGALALTKGG